jgi:integrase
MIYLAFRTYICSLKKRNGDPLAPAHVNKHMKLLRAVLTEAAERFGFISSYRGIEE